jgi:hypothetical protein
LKAAAVSFGYFLLIICALLIVLSIWMTSSQKDPNKRAQAAKPNKNNGPSSDFSALIDAIHYEGAANRGEESREDFGKKVRDYITIVILGLTLIALYQTYVAISDQVAEMRKVYGPIAEQAQIAHDNIVADHRAWVGPLVQTIEKPTINQPIVYSMQYGNSGKQPALLVTGGVFKIYTIEQWNSGEAGGDIQMARDSCFSLKDKFTSASTVAFPTSGFGGYTFNAKSPGSGPNKIVVDQDMLDGKKIIAFLACFRYMAYDIVRHTTTCGFYQADLNSGTGPSPNTVPLNFCVGGNDAD